MGFYKLKDLRLIGMPHKLSIGHYVSSDRKGQKFLVSILPETDKSGDSFGMVRGDLNNVWEFVNSKDERLW